MFQGWSLRTDFMNLPRISSNDSGVGNAVRYALAIKQIQLPQKSATDVFCRFRQTQRSAAGVSIEVLYQILFMSMQNREVYWVLERRRREMRASENHQRFQRLRTSLLTAVELRPSLSQMEIEGSCDAHQHRNASSHAPESTDMDWSSRRLKELEGVIRRIVHPEQFMEELFQDSSRNKEQLWLALRDVSQILRGQIGFQCNEKYLDLSWRELTREKWWAGQWSEQLVLDIAYQLHLKCEITPDYSIVRVALSVYVTNPKGKVLCLAYLRRYRLQESPCLKNIHYRQLVQEYMETVMKICGGEQGLECVEELYAGIVAKVSLWKYKMDEQEWSVLILMVLPDKLLERLSFVLDLDSGSFLVSIEPLLATMIWFVVSSVRGGVSDKLVRKMRLRRTNLCLPVDRDEARELIMMIRQHNLLVLAALK